MKKETIYILSHKTKGSYTGTYIDKNTFLYKKDNGPSGTFTTEVLPIYSEKYNIDWSEFIFGVVMSDKSIFEKIWEIQDTGRLISGIKINKEDTKKITLEKTNTTMWGCGDYYFMIIDAYSEPYGVYDAKLILLSNKKNSGKVFKSIKDLVGELYNSTKGYFTTEDLQLVEEYKNTFKNTK